MKELILMKLSIIVLSIVLCNSICNSQSHVDDYFPLAVGNSWTYNYNITEWEQFGGSNLSDSGIVVYKIISKDSTRDPLIWNIQENRNILHTFTSYGTGFIYDTSYSIKDSSVFQIIEFNSGDHKLLSTVTNWRSVFYLNSIFNDTVSFLRYLPASIKDTVCINYKKYYQTKLYNLLGIVFQRNIGIKSISYSAPGMTGFVPCSNHTLKSSFITNIAKKLVSNLPEEHNLLQNYPNPFNPSTVISYQLSAPFHISLKVYDAIGREVAELVNEMNEAGYHSRNFDGSQFPSGIYFYKLTVGEYSSTKGMILIK